MDRADDPGSTVEQIEPARALTLRAALRHPSGPGIEVVDPGDHDPATVHLGAYRRGTLVGVATATPEPLPGWATARGIRIHGIAVEHGLRGRGIGALLLDSALRAARAHGASVVWASVPASVHGFFDHFGFRRIGDPFEDDAGVPHYRMVLDLAPGG